MRLFVAVDISDETRRAFRRVREHIQSCLASRTPPRLVWVDDEAAHVTLRFIGSVTEAQRAAIEDALRQGFDLAAFDVEWATVGTFPPGRSPRVVWLGATSDLAPLRQLAALVNSRLEPIVPRVDTHPYSPHLTVARIKDPGRGADWVGTLARGARTHCVARSGGGPVREPSQRERLHVYCENAVATRLTRREAR